METVVKCKICGVEKGHLCRHIPCSHNITCKEYQIMFPEAKVWSESFLKLRKPPRLNTSTSKEGRKNMSVGAIGKVLSPEHRKNIGIGVKENLKDPIKREKQIAQLLSMATNNPYKCGWIRVLDQDVYYRSSYESKGLEILELNKKDILEFKSEKIQIPYLALTGEIKTTVPDWLVTLTNGNRYLIEVKPEEFLKDPKTIVKLQSAEGWAKANGITYCLWLENTIFNPSSETTSLEEILKATATDQNGLRYSPNNLVIG